MVCWVQLCCPPCSMYSNLKRVPTYLQGFCSCIFLRKNIPNLVLIFCLQMGCYDICLAFHFYNCLLGKFVILMTKVLLFPLLILEKTKISKVILLVIAQWFRFVLTFVFRLPNAGSAEYLPMLLLFNIQRICYFLEYHTYTLNWIPSPNTFRVPCKFIGNSSFL